MSTSDLKNTPHGAVQSLEPNRLYEGVVENCDPVQNVFSVRVGATLVSPCKWGAGIMSGMLGIRTNYLPPPNTRVVLAYFVSGSIVVGSVPHSLPHAAGVKSRQLTGGGAIMNRDGRKANAGNPAATQALGNNPPIDLLEGEVEVASAMGAGIALLTNLARLQAGDLAKVEVSLIDDTVRIVADRFVHFTAFGNKEDYNDGRLNSRVEGTSYPYEAFGLAAENLPKVNFAAANADGSGSTLDVNLGKVDEIYGTLRSRYSQFLGFLGDFVNRYVTDPATALGQAATARSGKFREHIGNDGGYLVQSVADITFERVCRIPVPIERTRWDDPTGNLAAGFDTLAAGPLKAWVYDPNPANIFQAAYQLRHYARWLSGVYGLARYQQLTKDWAIPTEAQTPAPDRNSGEVDRKAANAGLPPAYIDTYATIRIYRDGSIQLFNGYGCSVNMAGPDVQVSAARNLHLEAAGDMVLVAGQNFVVKARQSVEITAAHGGLILKARTWFRSIVTAGSMWFRSEAIDPGSANYTAPAADSNQDPVPQVLPAAILFQAPYGKTEIATANELGVNVTGANLPAGTISGVRVWTDGEIVGQASQNVTISSRLGSVILKAAGDMVVGAQRFMNYLTFGVFDVNNTFTVRPGGQVSASTIRTREMISTTVLSTGISINGVGNLTQAIPSGKEQDPAYTPVPFGKLDGDQGSPSVAQAAFTAQPTSPPLLTQYKPGFQTKYTTQLFETLTQQAIRLGTSTIQASGYGQWAWSGDGLSGDLATATSFPWPGRNPQDLTTQTGVDLTTPCSAPYSSFTNTAAPLSLRNKVLNFVLGPTNPS